MSGTVVCVNAGDTLGNGTGLLTVGKVYTVLGTLGGYYDIKCDDGVVRSKLKIRFKRGRTVVLTGS